MNQNSSEKLTSVLIVEDEMIIAQDIARISENCGYKVLDIVASGENAVKIAEKRKPDVPRTPLAVGLCHFGLCADAKKIKYPEYRR